MSRNTLGLDSLLPHCGLFWYDTLQQSDTFQAFSGIFYISHLLLDRHHVNVDSYHIKYTSLVILCLVGCDYSYNRLFLA